MMKAILKNPTVDINVCDPHTGVNSFWLAAFFGHGDVMQILGENGIDVLNQHKESKSNALHIAVEKNNPKMVRQLIDSGFPLDIPKERGVTALIASCNREIQDEEENISVMLVEAGADLNLVTDGG
jgi:ankyrin repeat protein